MLPAVDLDGERRNRASRHCVRAFEQASRPADLEQANHDIATEHRNYAGTREQSWPHRVHTLRSVRGALVVEDIELQLVTEHALQHLRGSSPLRAP